MHRVCEFAIKLEHRRSLCALSFFILIFLHVADKLRDGGRREGVRMIGLNITMTCFASGLSRSMCSKLADLLVPVNTFLPKRRREVTLIPD
ncbi:hypothetical protein GN956_G22449 [Arapaima gigas]